MFFSILTHVRAYAFSLASERGLTHVHWPQERGTTPKSNEKSTTTNNSATNSTESTSTVASSILDRAVTQLQEYFDGKRVEFDVPLDFSSGTEFQQAAWKALTQV